MFNETTDKLGMIRCDLLILSRDLKEALPDLPHDELLEIFATYVEYFTEYVKNIKEEK